MSPTARPPRPIDSTKYCLLCTCAPPVYAYTTLVHERWSRSDPLVITCTLSLGIFSGGADASRRSRVKPESAHSTKNLLAVAWRGQGWRSGYSLQRAFPPGSSLQPHTTRHGDIALPIRPALEASSLAVDAHLRPRHHHSVPHGCRHGLLDAAQSSLTYRLGQPLLHTVL